MRGQQAVGSGQQSGGEGLITVAIGELVLHGFSPADGRRIGEGLERELARLLAEGESPPRLAESVTRDRLDLGNIHAQAGTRPETIGAQIARSIVRGLEQ